jgi:hypothetical protein
VQPLSSYLHQHGELSLAMRRPEVGKDPAHDDAVYV